MLVGIVPVNMLLYIINDVSCVLLARKDSGIGPSRLFFASQTSVNTDPLSGANVSGIVPVKEFSDTRYDASSDNAEISKKADPVNIFSSTSINCNEVSNDSTVGSVPPIIFAYISNDARAVNTDNSDGKSPLKLFLAERTKFEET